MFFSYSIFLLILSFLIEFSSIVYFFIFITPITIFISNKFYFKKSIFLKLLVFLMINIYSILSVILIHENIFYYNNFKKQHVEEFNINLYDKENKLIELEKNKIYIFDFWTTSCSACIEKFPDFSRLCKKYSDNKKIEFYTVNVKLNKNEGNKSLKYILNKNYCFNNLFLKSKDEAERIDVNGYPTVLIIKNNKIIYNGYPSFNKIVFFNNLSNLIEEQIIN